jgi:NAD(P) transhydrogenase
MSSAFDVLVIGSGPGGEKAAMQAAKLRRRVALVDRGDRLGGNCLHTATVPSKTLRETILYIAGVKQRSLYGIQTTLGKHVTVEDLVRRKDAVIDGQIAVLENKLDRNDVTLVRGLVRFLDPHRLEVVEPGGSRRELSAGTIIIATGSRPARDPSIPFDDDNVYDSDTILGIDLVPRSLTIVGAGIIGCEYACMFALLGTRVTLVDARTRVLDFADGEIAELLVSRMREHHITMRLGEEVAGVNVESPGRVVATMKSGKRVVGEKLLYAVGREGNTAGRDLAQAGLASGKHGLLTVNRHFQTSVPHIYAVGDVIDFPSLAATTMHQGRLAMAHALGLAVNGEGTALPYGIFTIPGDLDGGRDRGAAHGGERAVRGRPGILPRDRARRDRRRSGGHAEAPLRAREPPPARRAHHRREGLGAGPHRASGARLRRARRLLRRHGVQLPDALGGV